ncbi:hypothetical protein TrVFT333_007061 [Trichoderma virens FT-333]|nr:hypothetical protein TrVFT333_007061 [Trichoderma virens FT-333]
MQSSTAATRLQQEGMKQVRLLLAVEAVDTTSEDIHHRTPLWWAAAGGHEAIVQLLLDVDGIDPNSSDSCDRTPLSIAAARGYEAVVRLLLATDGVDLNSEGIHSRTPTLDLRVSMQKISEIEGLEPQTEAHPTATMEYRRKILQEVETLCNDLLRLIDESHLPTASTGQSKGYHNRYPAEVCSGLLHGTAIVSPEEAYKVTFRTTSDLNDKSRKLSIKNLHGCVNDVKALKAFLDSKYEFKNPVVFTSPTLEKESSEALPTYANIKRQFDAIYDQASARDIFFFHFSGHGEQLDRVKASPAGRSHDASLITADFCCGQPASHAAGSWRRPNTYTMRTPGWSAVPNLLIDELTVKYEAHTESCTRDAKSEVSWLINPEGFTLMAACDDKEAAAEITVNGKVVGALTYTLLNYLEQGFVNGICVDYLTIRHQVAQQLKKQGCEHQKPKIYGRHRLLFLGSIEPFLTVFYTVRIEGDRVIITVERVAIVGLGGLARCRLPFQFRDEYPDCSVFWIPAVDTVRIENTFIEIGRQLKVKGIDEDGADIKQLVKAALSQGSIGNWLLIIDNLDNIELFFGNIDNADSLPLSEYLPFSRKGSILITTRNDEVAVRLDIHKRNTIATAEMARDEALEIHQAGIRIYEDEAYIILGVP